MSRRNARERRRVRVINDMLKILRDKLPEEWTTKKMSKLEILKKSTLYISRLAELAEDDSFVKKTDKRYGTRKSVSENLKQASGKQQGEPNGIENNITEGGFILARVRKESSVSSDDMNGSVVDTPSEDFGENFHGNLFDEFNTSEELMHVDTFSRT
ncbi:achaete-scute homolog 1a-like [Saccostrea cucullata]|uniref:achaete-scute homolog 1a-like n=1 Tax=Saccostrea cuccullata TaxID=36930 RepID=UPI002ED61BBF